STGVADFLAQYLGLVDEADAVAEPMDAEPAEIAPADDADVRDDAEAILLGSASNETPDIRPEPASEPTDDRIEAMIARWTGLTAAIDETPAPSDPPDKTAPEMRTTPVQAAAYAERAEAEPGDDPHRPADHPDMRARSKADNAGAGKVVHRADQIIVPAEMTATTKDRPAIDTVLVDDTQMTRSEPTPPTAAAKAPALSQIATGNPVVFRVQDNAPVMDAATPDAGWQAEIPVRHEVDAPVTTPRTAETHAPAVARQIAQAAVTLREGEIELALAPEELGRLRLRVTQAEGGATVTVWFERPEVLEAARRHLDLLIRDLQDSGFESPSLDLRDESTWNGPDQDASEDRASADAALVPATDESPRHVPLSDRPLDIRV
ncbi:MAG: flagellar hook-length control protein FliK, partial [Paracoccus sp. (in: a-proteobacteria)]|nr:flagellar hook-length control protein FliK [Paracoccus sp. (in: a-proteobacteria)]